MNYMSWVILKVKQGTPIEVCTPEQMSQSRESVGKRGYSFNREIVCEEHIYSHGFCELCSDCKIETVTYTEESRLAFAIKCAENGCDRYQDCWVVDGDTGEVIAAFRLHLEKLL